MAQISFVIPVRNDAERLRVCLASIAANRRVPGQVEIVVADNGSPAIGIGRQGRGRHRDSSPGRTAG